MTSTDLDLLSRTAAEFAILIEQNYGPQDHPAEFVRANPEEAALLFEIADHLRASNTPIPENLAFIVSFLPRSS